MHVSFEESVGPFSVALTDENLQSRIRGTTLMAVSSERNALVLTTGNKSEIAVGYSTLYGDTAGAFAPIKDLYKTDVYRLASWYNAQTHGAAIPQHILDKPPSAELRPDQTDQDSLPDYDTLDRILALYIEDDQTVGEIVAGGVDRTLAQRIASLVDRAEFKRRQSPLGPKLTTKAFGRDRRVPITSKFPG
jgi:NAD+ synthase (glutamine-hydrolysing)